MNTSTVATTAARPGARPVRMVALIGATFAVGLVLAACDGSGDAAAGAAESPADGSDSGGAGPTGGAPTMPRVTGVVAALSGDVAQVQDGDSQTAVTWTAETTVTQEVAGSFADVAVGSCVSATPDSQSAAADGSGSDPVAAVTVTITPAADDGSCTSIPGGFGGFSDGGERSFAVPDGEAPEGMPSDMPSGMPEGGGNGAGAFGGAVFGTVTAVSDGGFTVEQVSFALPDGEDAAGDAETATREVTVSESTTYTATASADTSAIAVGQCMTALGDEDSSGTITADTIALSDPGDSGCTVEFGRGTMGGDLSADGQTQGDGDA